MHRRSCRESGGLDDVNIKAFFVTALSSALELGIATADDVLRHVTPDLLAQHLPRPLWARLLTACIGAPKVDPQLVVETVGVSNLCEHLPTTTIWALIADVASRSLGGGVSTITQPVLLVTPKAAGPSFETRTPAKPLSIGSPPPVESRPTPTPPPATRGPSIPAPKDVAISVGLDDVVAELEAEDVATPPTRARTPTGNRFRQTSTNIGRLATANQQRRPQAAVPAPATGPDPATERPAPKARRGETEIEVEVETDVRSAEDWRTALAVEDEQLVDWSSSEETQTTTEGDSRKR
jgi:hypothetical protein